MNNILTFDVEDWFEGLDTNPENWSRYESRVEKSTEKILSILAHYNTRATFFFLGYIADLYPGIVKEVYNRGHEVGAHGYYHRFIYHQAPNEFKNEVIRTKTVLEEIIGSKILGFRAPYFSITESTLWALDILAELGFAYDSSIFPIKNYRYGIPDARRDPHTIVSENNRAIVEFPISTIRFSGRNWPFSGGIYFRFLHCKLVENGIHSLNRKGWPAVVYLHPWEFDPHQPVYIRIPLSLRLRHYYALERTESKLEHLLKACTFTPVVDFLKESQ